MMSLEIMSLEIMSLIGFCLGMIAIVYICILGAITSHYSSEDIDFWKRWDADRHSKEMKRILGTTKKKTPWEKKGDK